MPSVRVSKDVYLVALFPSHFSLRIIQFTNLRIPLVFSFILSFGSAMAQSVELEWDPNSEPDLAGYNVYRSLSSGSGYSIVNPSLVPSPSYTDTTVTPGNTYYYVVTAQNTGGLESGFSNEINTFIEGLPPTAALTLVKSSDATSAPAVGETITYSYVVTNSGEVTLTGITVTDVHGGIGGSFSGVSCPATSIAVGDSMTCTATYVLVQADVNAGSISNTATADSNETGPVSSSLTVSLSPNAALTLVKSSDATPDPAVGETITYSYVATNGGEVTLTGVTVTDVHGGIGGSFSGVSCPATSLAVGDSMTCTATYVLVQADADAGSVSNTATADSNETGPVSSSLTVSLSPNAALALVKSSDATPDPAVGETITYSYVATNGGEVTLTGVTVTDVHGGIGGSFSGVSCPATSIAVGDSMTCTATYVLVQADVNAGSISNTATADSNETGPVNSSLTVLITTIFLVLPTTFDLGSPEFEDTFVGAAIANLSDQPAHVVVSALTSFGTEVASQQLGDELSAMGQDAFLTTDHPELVEGSSSWLLRGTSAKVRGFFMIGDRDMNKLDGIGGELDESKSLFFPLARESAAGSTLLHLFNVEKQAGTVTLTLFEPLGIPVAEAEITVAPSGGVQGTMEEIFGAGLEFSDGYLEVQSSVRLKGFEFYAQEGAFAAVPGQAPQPTWKLWTPHFFVEGQSGDTEIRLLSTDSERARVSIQGFDNESTLIGTYELEIEPGQLFVGSVREMLNLDPGMGVITGHLEISLEAGTFFTYSPQVLGLVTFSANGGKWLSTLPLLTEGHKETLFLQVAQSDQIGMFTGLAVLNPGESAAQVEVEVFDQNGIRTGRAGFSLAPGQRVLNLLDGDTYFGDGFEQIKGLFRVRSTVPVLSFSLFGDYGLRFLSAVEGQYPE